MNTIASVIGLDIAKNVFVAMGRDERGKPVWKKTLARDGVLAFFANLPPTPVGIEACSGSHYWARQLLAMGHGVKLIAAQHTRAYVTGNKNDANDAAAIAEARSRAATKYVAVNTEAQQDLQMLHPVVVNEDVAFSALFLYVIWPFLMVGFVRVEGDRCGPFPVADAA
jgi:transposase